MQDVASGTTIVKLQTGQKTKLPNSARTANKAEVIRLYLSACERRGTHKRTDILLRIQSGVFAKIVLHHKGKT